jgi:hypothetical protein
MIRSAFRQIFKLDNGGLFELRRRNVHSLYRNLGMFKLPFRNVFYSVGWNRFIECSNCAVSTYSVAVGSIACLACQAGTYSSVTGAGSCILCPFGYQSLMIGASTSAVCTPCNAGSYASSGSVACTSCGAGYFQPSASQSTCLNCPGGTYSTVRGAVATTSCFACSAGRYSAVSSVSCALTCPAGMYSLGAQALCSS